MFRVPPYILYVARAFSTLEGIGLTANEDYSLVSEAFPYLSQRLLTDESPRAKAALRSMLYSQGTRRQGSLKKFLEMSEGFTSYSTATTDTEAQAGADRAQDELLEVLLSAEGGYVQELLLEEAAKLADAMVRDRLASASRSPAAQGLSSALRAPKQLGESILSNAPAPLSPLVDGLLGPARALDELAGLVPSLAPTTEDDQMVRST